MNPNRSNAPTLQRFNALSRVLVFTLPRSAGACFWCSSASGSPRLYRHNRHRHRRQPVRPNRRRQQLQLLRVRLTRMALAGVRRVLLRHTQVSRHRLSSISPTHSSQRMLTEIPPELNFNGVSLSRRLQRLRKAKGRVFCSYTRATLLPGVYFLAALQILSMT
jgi:hypothetical protein